MIEFLTTVIEHGGVFAYLLIGLGVFAAAVAVERFYVLNFRYSVNGKEFWKEIRSRIEQRQVEEAIKICDNAPLPQIVKSGLVEAAKASPRIKEAMDETSLEVIPRIEKRTHYLASLANIAMLMGLLGTVIGLISAFAAVAQANPAEKASLLAASISVAMNNTALGLVTAITLLLAHLYLETKTTEIVDSLEIASVKFLNALNEKKMDPESLQEAARGQARGTEASVRGARA